MTRTRTARATKPIATRQPNKMATSGRARKRRQGARATSRRPRDPRLPPSPTDVGKDGGDRRRRQRGRQEGEETNSPARGGPRRRRRRRGGEGDNSSRTASGSKAAPHIRPRRRRPTRQARGEKRKEPDRRHQARRESTRPVRPAGVSHAYGRASRFPSGRSAGGPPLPSRVTTNPSRPIITRIIWHN